MMRTPPDDGCGHRGAARGGDGIECRGGDGTEREPGARGGDTDAGTVTAMAEPDVVTRREREAAARRPRPGEGCADDRGPAAAVDASEALVVVVRPKGRRWLLDCPGLPAPARTPRRREAALAAAEALLAEHGGGEVVVQAPSGEVVERFAVSGLAADAATVIVRSDGRGGARLIDAARGVDMAYPAADAAAQTARELLIMCGGGQLLLQAADGEPTGREVVPRPMWWTAATQR